MQLYPGWSARDNYGYGTKKKKRKKERAPIDSGGTYQIHCHAALKIKLKKKKKNGQSVCAELICDVGAHGSTLGICRSLSNRRRAYVRATLFGGGWGACAEWVGVASVVAYLRLRLLGARRRDDSTRRRRQVLSLSV